MSNNNFDDELGMLVSMIAHLYGIDTARLEVRLKADGDDLHIDEMVSTVSIRHADGHPAVSCKTSRNGVEPILAMPLMGIASKEVCEAADQQMEQAKEEALDDMLELILADAEGGDDE